MHKDDPEPGTPRAGAHWGHKDIDYEMAAGLGLGDRVRVILEGTMTGQSMQEYGCSVELTPSAVRVEKIAGATAAAVKKLHHRMKGEEHS